MPKIGSTPNRAKNLEVLLSLITPIPDSLLKYKASGNDGPGASENLAECTEYREMINAWRRALKWTDGLDRALSVMLASIISTEAIGDQLWIKVIGPASCLAGTTKIKYVVRDIEGNLVNKKGGDLRTLYNRFNNLKQGSGPKRRTDVRYFVPSVTDDGVIVLNAVKGVVRNGIKQTYRLTTLTGKSVEATSDHEVYTEHGFRALAEIRVGDKVYVNNGKTQKKGRTKPKYRKEILVKYHSKGSVKIVNGYEYFRVRLYHAIYEANQNEMHLREYVNCLNTWDRKRIESMWRIPDGHEVHHKDGNCQNNELGNLELLASSADHHNEYHNEESAKHLAILAELDEVVAIRTSCKQMVYDIICSDPYRNFAANGIIVHNCGKSTLCEAVSMSHKYVMAKSTIRGFHSGWKSDGEGKEDNSLIAKVKGKTLVTKDGDTLLQSPNLGQILSEARDIYDSTSRSHYRNKMGKDYKGIRMTWLLCGTNSLRSIDSSELGERFLNCVIMDGIDDELEDDILLRLANRSYFNLSLKSGVKTESQHDPAMGEAMRATGGYVEYLRDNDNDLLSRVQMSQEVLARCATYGKFIAYMRARPSKIQDEKSERELAGRLVSQIIRLAGCLAAVMNKTNVDTDVMRRVRLVTLDTARGRTLEIVKVIRQYAEGAENHTISIHVGHDKLGMMLRFLKMIGALEVGVPDPTNKVKNPKPRWFLTRVMKRLFDQTMEGGDA